LLKQKTSETMTDEERQRAMDFIMEQQAKNSVAIDKLTESQRQAELRFERDEHKLDRVERVLKLIVRAGLRERRTRSEGDDRLTNALADLAKAQKRTEESMAHTDSRLDALIDIVRQQRNGSS
jgi:hypothetical protein